MASMHPTKGGGYIVRWRVRDTNGVLRPKGSRFHSHSAAKAHLAKVLRLEVRKIGTVTFSLHDYLTGWVEKKAKTVRRNTLAGYQQKISNIASCNAAAVPLDKLTAEHLDQAYQELLERGLKPQSVRHVHAVVRNALKDAVRHRRIEDNPALHAKPPAGQSPRTVAPTVEQIMAFIADLEAHNPELLELALLYIDTGLRRGEALALRWQDIDFAEAQLTVQQVLIEHAGKWSLHQGSKSVAGLRTLSLEPETIALLRRQQVKVAEARLAIGRFWEDNNLVFPNPQSGRLKAPASVTKAFARAKRRAGWPERAKPVHGLRHAAASHALAVGGEADLAAVSKRLGHSSPAVTARIYLTSSAQRDRAVAAAMAGITSHGGKRRGG